MNVKLYKATIEFITNNDQYIPVLKQVLTDLIEIDGNRLVRSVEVIEGNEIECPRCHDKSLSCSPHMPPGCGSCGYKFTE